jgi:excisionase family DNA binding protein
MAILTNTRCKELILEYEVQKEKIHQRSETTPSTKKRHLNELGTINHLIGSLLDLMESNISQYPDRNPDTPEVRAFIRGKRTYNEASKQSIENAWKRGMSEILLTPEQVATRLKLKPRTVREMLRSKELPGVKLGILWRIRESSLDDYIRALDRTDSETK